MLKFGLHVEEELKIHLEQKKVSNFSFFFRLSSIMACIKLSQVLPFPMFSHIYITEKLLTSKWKKGDAIGMAKCFSKKYGNKG